MAQVHRQDRVAGGELREVDGHVCLRPRVRLHVRVLGAKDLLRARDRQRLDLVDELAPAVVPLSRVPLGVLVGENRSLRLEHRLADDVLRRDQLEIPLLPLPLPLDRLVNLGISTFERSRH